MAGLSKQMRLYDRFSMLLDRWQDGKGRDLRLARFRRILLAAQRTRRYRQALELAGLASPQAIAGVCSIEEALHQLPYVEWGEFRGSPADFNNPTAPAPALQRLRCPINHEMRTAVLGSRLAESNSVRVFHPGRFDQIRQFRPEAIAAPAGVLKQMAENALHQAEAVPKVTHAIVAFTGPEHGALSETDRDILWELFEVPIFEQCLWTDGSLLAWECEAHEGLHIVEENAIVEQSTRSELVLTSLTDHQHPAIRLVTGLAGTLQHETCGCGQPGPRLVGLSAPAVDQRQSAVAAAEN
jgi:hypothetical protein